MGRRVAPEEEFLVPRQDGGTEGIAVFGLLGERLAEVVGLRGNGVDSEVEVVRCDGARDVGGQVEHARDGSGRGGVFEDYAEGWKIEGEAAQVGQKVHFGVQDGDVLREPSGQYPVRSFLRRRQNSGMENKAVFSEKGEGVMSKRK